LIDISTENIKKEYENLKKEIQKHDKLYYVESKPIIDDRKYDEMFNRLLEIEKKHPEIKAPDSPSNRVGGLKNEGFEKVNHSIPMLSLDNTYSEEEIIEFDKRIKKNIKSDYNYSGELKIDGVSISLIYESGVLKRAITRGNGITGEDITQNVKTIRTIPLKISKDIDIEVRGEIFMPNKEFKRINEERENSGKDVFANPRNSTAGTLKLLDTKEVAKRRLDNFIYYLINPEKYGVKTQTEALDFLKEIGFKINKHNKILRDVEEVIKYWNYWNKNRKELEYDTDGIVLKINDFEIQKKLGTTVRSPRWAIAFKFEAEQKETKIKEIKLQVGSSGIITPVAILEPVNLEGSTVQRASLHNFDYIDQRDIRDKDYVLIQKAGGIIPQILEPIKEKRTGEEIKIHPPSKCPICDSETGKLDEEEVAIRCLNPLCPAKLKRTLEKFASNSGMNIEGLGPKLIERLFDSGLIEDLGDIYKLDKQKILSLGEGIGEKTANNLIKQIEQSKNRPLENIIYAIGVPGVGKKIAKDLSNKFKNIDNLLKAAKEELTNIDGIGKELAESIKSFFEEEMTKRVLEKMKKYGVQFSKKEVSFKNNVLQDKIISQTGSLKSMTRKDFSDYVEKRGGEFSSNVTKNTDILVIGEYPGSKLQKAEKYGIKILEEDDFFTQFK
jgi:DNA ligase (NAD+)